MGYLICHECGGYYKLEKGESKDDFVSCECYGSLTYVEDLDDYLRENNKLDKDFPMGKNRKSIENDYDNSDNNYGDNHEVEVPHQEQNSKSISFPSFKGYGDGQLVKDRNYYRKINSKDQKPDIERLMLIKDVNCLVEALNYPDSAVKLEAVKALGSIGDERALIPLYKVKSEEKGILKTYAENAIFHIESKKKGLKSQNRAYYREEYYKEVSSKTDGTNPFNQGVKEIKGINKPPNQSNNQINGDKAANKEVCIGFNSLQSNSHFTPSVIKKDIDKKPIQKSDEYKVARDTELKDDDLYFIQFLGIKNTDKPLIGFILLFAVSLIIGVLLTMGYK